MKTSQAKQAMATALPFTIFLAIACAIMALVIAASNASSSSDSSQTVTPSDDIQTVTADDSLDIMFDNIQAAIDESGVEGVTIVR